MERLIISKQLLFTALISIFLTLFAFDSLAHTNDKKDTELIEEEIVVGNLVFDAVRAGPENGELIIFLHGFPESAVEWRGQQKKLAAEGYLTIAFNQRGYSSGARPESFDNYTSPQLAQDVLDVADALGAESFHLVGHDWGAFIAWRVAEMASERVKSLVAISSPHPTAYLVEFSDPTSCQAEAGAYIYNFLNPGFEDVLLADDAALLKQLYSEIEPEEVEAHLNVVGTSEALGAALNWYRAAFMSTPAPLVGQLSTPTTLIWGDQDPYLCGEAILATEGYMTGPYKLKIIKGAGHWLPEVLSDVVSKSILKQVREVKE